jgi:cell division transport system permease protein
MTLLQALGYFLREALLNIRRGWKVSLLAVAITAISLFLGGVFLLLGTNLASRVADWRAEAKVVVYLQEGIGPEVKAGIEKELVEKDWITRWREVSALEAERQFRSSFPHLESLLESWEDEPLPASIEVGLRAGASEQAPFNEWLERLESLDGVAMVDSDYQWLKQVEMLAALLRGTGVVVGFLLLSGAAFSIASAVRLAAFLHRDEIRVMRLVGATEFYVRGPFIVEGLIQGLSGSVAAILALYAGFVMLKARDLPTIADAVFLGAFLSPSLQFSLALLGTLAGLVGGLMSLRRESGEPG